MMGIFRMQHYLLVTTVLIGLFVLVKSSTESDANEVEIKVYPASKSDWTTAKESSFASTVAAQATQFCGQSPSVCGLDSSVTFTSSDVTADDEEESSRSLKMNVYISYPSGANVTSGGSTTTVLPQTALKEILKDARDAVKDAIDMYITYIGSDYYGVPIDSTTNKIMIPVASVTVLAIGIAAVIMVYAQENQERKARQAERVAKKRALRTLPNYDIPEIPGETSPNTTAAKAVTATATAVPLPAISPRVNNMNNTISPDLGYSEKPVKKPTKQQEYTSASAYPPLPPPSHHDSVNYFHSNGLTSVGTGEYSNILPPLTTTTNTHSKEHNNSNGNVTTTTTTIGFQNHKNAPAKMREEDEEDDEHDDSDKDRAAEREERRRKRKEKKREKKRLLQQQKQEGIELEDADRVDASVNTMSEEEIPTFTVQRVEPHI